MTNQPHVSAAADDVRPVAGKYYTGMVNHHHLGTCEVYLANAPESVLSRLRAMHPGVYVIHNDAPRSLTQIEGIIERVDVPALRDAGMSIHQIGPTQHGYVRVAVERDAPAAQAKLDAMLGPDVIRVVEAPMAQALPYRGPGTPG
jgi:hypothetical protein